MVIQNSIFVLLNFKVGGLCVFGGGGEQIFSLQIPSSEFKISLLAEYELPNLLF